MNNWKKWSFAGLLFVPLLMGLTSCENNNLFSKLSGESSDPATLTAQGNIALRNKDYGKALELFNRVLANNPNDSEALYGAVAAQLGSSGLNFTALITNIVSLNSSSVSGLHGLGDVMAQGRERFTTQATCTTDQESILYGINCTALSGVINQVICRLTFIISGSATGSIEANNTILLIDGAILRVIRAALRALEISLIDITNTGGSFTVSAGANYNTACTNNPTEVHQIAEDLGVAYIYFNRVIGILGLSANSLVAEIRDDVDSAAVAYLNGSAGAIPAACTNSGGPLEGITSVNYKSFFQTEAFAAPSSPC